MMISQQQRAKIELKLQKAIKNNRAIVRKYKSIDNLKRIESSYRKQKRQNNHLV